MQNVLLVLISYLVWIVESVYFFCNSKAQALCWSSQFLLSC